MWMSVQSAVRVSPSATTHTGRSSVNVTPVTISSAKQTVKVAMISSIFKILADDDDTDNDNDDYNNNNTDNRQFNS